MSKALYRKYRSTSLDTIVGQDHITSLLRRHIDSGTISHAYLLTGPRGVGKTSIARIIAHEINKLPYDGSSHLDIIEIDAASNNGVEDVRDLREKVHIAPALASRKVYIIDEVHMLSRQAFNALLKTLEEPPAHVVFILATTDADKLPATILSRVQRYNFRSITVDDTIKHLQEIADKEAIAVDKEALALIAEHAGGSFRDSIGLLDQLRHSAVDQVLSRQIVEQAIGLAQESEISQLIDSFQAQDIEAMAQTIQKFEASGASATLIAWQLIKQLSATLHLRPQDAATLGRLIEVQQSSYPYIKLLVALVSETATPPTSPPKLATKSAPEAKSRSPQATKPKPTASSNPKPTEPVAKSSLTPKPTASKTVSLAPADFDWQRLITAAKEQSTGLATLLAKSSYEIDADKLIIYAGNKFSAKRLEAATKLVELNAALSENDWSKLEVVIEPTTKPPSDSRAASVAAIMGGGEEVEIQDE